MSQCQWDRLITMTHKKCNLHLFSGCKFPLLYFACHAMLFLICWQCYVLLCSVTTVPRCYAVITNSSAWDQNTMSNKVSGSRESLFTSLFLRKKENTIDNRWPLCVFKFVGPEVVPILQFLWERNSRIFWFSDWVPNTTHSQMSFILLRLGLLTQRKFVTGSTDAWHRFVHKSQRERGGFKFIAFHLVRCL